MALPAGVVAAKPFIQGVQEVAKEGAKNLSSLKEGVDKFKNLKEQSSTKEGLNSLSKLPENVENFDQLKESSTKINDLENKFENDKLSKVELSKMSESLANKVDELTNQMNKLESTFSPEAEEVGLMKNSLERAKDLKSKVDYSFDSDNLNIDPNRPYNRYEINKKFNQVKSQMHQEAIERGGDGRALHKDCYTDETLRGGDRYDYEHERSSEEVFMKYRDILTNDEIAEVVNCPENVGVTLRSINQSKGKMKMEDWMGKSDNISKYNINKTLTEKSLSIADTGIQNKVNEILSTRE